MSRRKRRLEVPESLPEDEEDEQFDDRSKGKNEIEVVNSSQTTETDEERRVRLGVGTSNQSVSKPTKKQKIFHSESASILEQQLKPGEIVIEKVIKCKSKKKRLELEKQWLNNKWYAFQCPLFGYTWLSEDINLIQIYRESIRASPRGKVDYNKFEYKFSRVNLDLSNVDNVEHLRAQLGPNRVGRIHNFPGFYIWCRANSRCNWRRIGSANVDASLNIEDIEMRDNNGWYIHGVTIAYKNWPPNHSLKFEVTNNGEYLRARWMDLHRLPLVTVTILFCKKQK